MKNIHAKINENAVCKRASEPNGGHKCEIEHLPAWGRGSLMGCANYHARIRFDDGSVWLIRVPRINSSIPQSLIDYFIRSEYATLKFLETTRVPAPRAFGYGIAGNKKNKAGVSYILMEEMAGNTWNLQGLHKKCFADDKDKESVWNGLVDILIELQHHPFSKAGSLLPGPLPSEPIVSAVASEQFLIQSPSGPFDTASDYYTSFVEQNMALILSHLKILHPNPLHRSNRFKFKLHAAFLQGSVLCLVGYLPRTAAYRLPLIGPLLMV